MAMRLDRPDLASAALDGMNSAGISLGLYGPNLEILEHRIRIADSMENPWEVGDIFAMGAWGFGYVGDYQRSFELATEGAARSGEEAAGVWLHCTGWLAFSEFWRGNWTRVTELAALARRRLGDRAEDPPYFLSHLFGSEAFVLDARADPGAERRLDVVRRLSAKEGSLGSYVFSQWQSWILARRGAYEEAIALAEEATEKPIEIYRPFLDIVRVSVMLEARRFEESSDFLEASRAYAVEAGITALPPHLDRLEAAAALSAGDLGTALPLLERAREGFDRMGTPWELARTDLLRAEAMISAGRAEDARRVIEEVMDLFEELGSLRELAWARQLLASA
jgi:tetratricopeptide (TPR) repeat protein